VVAYYYYVGQEFMQMSPTPSHTLAAPFERDTIKQFWRGERYGRRRWKILKSGKMGEKISTRETIDQQFSTVLGGERDIMIMGGEREKTEWLCH
jgi:hypothetical protein